MDIPCLIFVQSKERVQELYNEIKNFGIPVAQITAVRWYFVSNLPLGHDKKPEEGSSAGFHL